MFIYSSISFALIVKENRSHKYSLKIFPSRPGELSVFPLNFPHKFNISAICQAVFEFCQNWKHFQRGRKTNRLLEGSLLNELLPTPLKDRKFCRISYDMKNSASRNFSIEEISLFSNWKGRSVVSTTERKNTCLRRIEGWRKRDCPGKRSLRRWAILPRDCVGPNLQSNFLQISEEILFRFYPEGQSFRYSFNRVSFWIWIICDMIMEIKQ